MFHTQNKSVPQANLPPAAITQGGDSIRIPHQKRHGMTLIETVAAAALLMVALGLAMKVIAASTSAEQAAQRKALATEILSSMLEKQMCTPVGELTQKEAAKWEVPHAADLLLTKAKLESEVISVAGPPAGKKVTLKLTWQETSGQRTAPLILSAWAFPQQPAEMNP